MCECIQIPPVLFLLIKLICALVLLFVETNPLGNDKAAGNGGEPRPAVFLLIIIEIGIAVI